MYNEKLLKQREYRARTGNSATNKYERTKKGKLMRIYRNMKSRIEGVQWKKHHLYQGKDLLSKEEFYAWAESQPEFHKLYDEWVDSDYQRKLAPSVDRIDSNKGYSIDNMEWVTHSENSRRGSRSRFGLS
jgi:hypothetical protein